MSLEHISDFDIGYSQKMRRLIFPVYFEGNLAGWQGWAIDEERVKAFTCPGFDKSKFLFNYDSVIGKEYVVLCEGPIDVVRAFKYNAVGLFGKKISKSQLNLLLSLNLKKIYIGLDPDAQKEAYELAKNLSGFIGDIRILEINEGRDLGDSNTEEIDKYVENSKKYEKKQLFHILKML